MLSHSQEFDFSSLFPDEKGGNDDMLSDEYVHVDHSNHDPTASPTSFQDCVDDETNSFWNRLLIIVIVLSVLQLSGMWYKAHQCAVAPLPVTPSASYLESVWNHFSDISHRAQQASDQFKTETFAKYMHKVPPWIWKPFSTRPLENAKSVLPKQSILKRTWLKLKKMVFEYCAP
jgi:hypothetical protein